MSIEEMENQADWVKKFPKWNVRYIGDAFAVELDGEMVPNVVGVEISPMGAGSDRKIVAPILTLRILAVNLAAQNYEPWQEYPDHHSS